MSHLVRHDVTNLREGALLQEVVIQCNPRRAEEAGNVRADPIRLPGSIDLKNLFHRNLVGARHRQDRFADRRIDQRFVLIEERLDVDRSDQDSESKKTRQ